MNCPGNDVPYSLVANLNAIRTFLLRWRALHEPINYSSVVIATTNKIRARSIWKPQKLQEREHINFMLITTVAISPLPQVITLKCNKRV